MMSQHCPNRLVAVSFIGGFKDISVQLLQQSCYLGTFLRVQYSPTEKSEDLRTYFRRVPQGYQEIQAVM